METKIIYEPRGKAREYSAIAANLFTGCGHGCLYCYAPDCLFMTREKFSEPRVRKNVLSLLESDCKMMPENCEKILLCFTCDPYQPCESETMVTRSALKILKENNIAFQILTKGGARAERDFDLYEKCDAFATTLTFTDAERSRYYEPGAAEPAERIRAIEKAKAAGIETWVSFEPVLDDREVFRLIDMTKDFVDLYKIGKISRFEPDVKIDWSIFAERIIEKMTEINKPFYIKDDLKKYLIN